MKEWVAVRPGRAPWVGGFAQEAHRFVKGGT